MKSALLRSVLLLSMPLSCLATLPLHADTILNENFSTAPVGLSATTAGAFTTLNGTNVDVLSPATAPSYGITCAANCVDLNGTGGNTYGQLATTLNLAAGTYYLSFDLGGSQRGQTSSTTVLFGSYDQTFVLASDDMTDGDVLNAIVTVSGGPTTLEFISNDIGGNANIGALLSSVSVTTPSAVPEPGTLSLMATGLIGAAGAVRRKMKA